MMMNETYIRVFSAAASTALQEMMRRGGSREQIADDAVEMALVFADRSIESDALNMQDGTATRLRVATHLAAALMPHMLHHTPWDVSQRAIQIADALIEAVYK